MHTVSYAIPICIFTHDIHVYVYVAVLSLHIMCFVHMCNHNCTYDIPVGLWWKKTSAPRRVVLGMFRWDFEWIFGRRFGICLKLFLDVFFCNSVRFWRRTILEKQLKTVSHVGIRSKSNTRYFNTR